MNSYRNKFTPSPIPFQDRSPVPLQHSFDTQSIEQRTLGSERTFFSTGGAKLKLVKRKKKIQCKSPFLRLLEVYKSLNGLSEERNLRLSPFRREVIKPIPLRKTLKLLNRQHSELKKNSKRKLNEIDEDQEEINFLSRLKKKTKFHDSTPVQHNKRFPPGLFSKMKNSYLKPKINRQFKDEEDISKVKAKRSFNEFFDKNIEDTVKDLEETDEGDSLSLKHMKPNDTPNEKYKDKKLCLSKEEKAKIFEEIDRFFSNQDESICKEKKIVLSIHVFQSGTPKRVEIQKKTFKEEISDFNKNEEKIVSKEKLQTEEKDTKTLYATQDRMPEIKKEEFWEDAVPENVAVLKKPETMKDDKKENMYRMSEDMIDEKNVNPPQVEKENSLFLNSSNTVKTNFDNETTENKKYDEGKVSPNPFLTTPTTMKFSITELIKSQQKQDENNFSFSNNHNISNFNNNLIEFCKPQENQAPNLFQNLFNNNPIQSNIQIQSNNQILNSPHLNQMDNEMNQNNQIDQINHMNQVNQMGHMNFMSPMNNFNQMNQVGQMEQMNQINQMNHMNQMNHLNQIGQLNHSNNLMQMNDGMNQIHQMNQVNQINQNCFNNVFQQNTATNQSLQTQNFNIFSLGEEQMDLNHLNVNSTPLGIDQKAASSLFSNQGNHNQISARGVLPKKFRQEQQKLRVFNGV